MTDLGTGDRTGRFDGRIEPSPEGALRDEVVLVAGDVNPAEHGLCLRALCQYGSGADRGIAVTTTASASETVDRYDSVRPAADGPALSLVDTVSEGQYVVSTYDEVPVVYIPGPADVEWLVIAISELTDGRSTTSSRHLLVRSVTPLLQNAPLDLVTSVLDRVTGVRSGGGISLLGVDYRSHDEATIDALLDHVDRVLWVRRPRPDRLDFEWREP